MRFSSSLAPALLGALSLGLSGCGQLSQIVQKPPQGGPPPSAAASRDDAATTRLLSFQAGDGSWNAPSGESWQPALALEAVINHYGRTGDARDLAAIERSFARYRGKRTIYFDDIGWYLNAWVRAYDVTGDPKYLAEARAIFADMTAGWDDTCGGGVWWNTNRGYKNAITNELFLLSAARLARRLPNGTGPGSYQDWALKEWAWFKGSGMIGPQKLVNDGLDDKCQNNGGLTWTYNQGVVLSGLVELWRLTGDRTYLSEAEGIAGAATRTLVYGDGTLKEIACETTPCDGADHFMFKGPLVQGLGRLVAADPTGAPEGGFLAFLKNNAATVWTKARTPDGGLGFVWNAAPGTVNMATQAAAGLLLGEVALLEGAGEKGTVPPPPPLPPLPINEGLYQAENAGLHGLGTESNFPGFTGMGYVAGWGGDGQYVDFKVNVAAAGTYTLVFRYGGGAGDASRLLFVNGADAVADLAFPGTGAWSGWSTAQASVTLKAGANTVSLIFNSSKGSKNYINLDSLEVR